MLFTANVIAGTHCARRLRQQRGLITGFSVSPPPVYMLKFGQTLNPNYFCWSGRHARQLPAISENVHTNKRISIKIPIKHATH